MAKNSKGIEIKEYPKLVRNGLTGKKVMVKSKEEEAKVPVEAPEGNWGGKQGKNR